MRVCVIGGGMYGRHAARVLDALGHDVTIYFQNDPSIASIVNQARIHGGYHYPRSVETASQSRKLYQRFKNEFRDAVIDDFTQIYGVPLIGSKVTPSQFERFCQVIDAPLERVNRSESLVKDTWITDECAIDTHQMMDIMVEKTSHIESIEERVVGIDNTDSRRVVVMSDTQIREFDYVVNCSYASLDEIIKMVEPSCQNVSKREYCTEILLNDHGVLQNTGWTFMDGPFCSIMPYTRDVYSLTSVTYTPCGHVPNENLARLMLAQLSKFIDHEIVQSLSVVDIIRTVKAVPLTSEVSDSRSVRFIKHPRMLSILGGKLSSIYDCDQVLERIENV